MFGFTKMDEPTASFGSTSPATSSFIPVASKNGLPDILTYSTSDGVAHEKDENLEETVPASPITVSTMQQLLKRPFADVLKEITATLQMKSTSHLATEQLRYLLHHDSSHHAEVTASPAMGLLVGLVRESPGLPAAGSAMAVLAMQALTPQGREALRAEQAVLPVMKFLNINGVLQKPNAEAALMLLQNASCDKLTRQALHKAEALRVLLDLLASNAGWLKMQPKLSGPLAGLLNNLVVADGDQTASKQAFVKAGGLEKTFQFIMNKKYPESSMANGFAASIAGYSAMLPGSELRDVDCSDDPIGAYTASDRSPVLLPHTEQANPVCGGSSRRKQLSNRERWDLHVFYLMSKPAYNDSWSAYARQYVADNRAAGSIDSEGGVEWESWHHGYAALGRWADYAQQNCTGEEALLAQGPARTATVHQNLRVGRLVYTGATKYSSNDNAQPPIPAFQLLEANYSKGAVWAARDACFMAKNPPSSSGTDQDDFRYFGVIKRVLCVMPPGSCPGGGVPT
eukprot:GHRQ01005887.1.p1 GENE.GHRQ01005887.1~~GHRQ01005887.1.p1  ORF type:complete len:513 (+),score=105.59 GHRQ01005887.1:224-1762(+)